MSAVGLLQGGRPPNVKFTQEAVEDRVESERQGKYVARNVDTVTVWQAGSKDSTPFDATDWLDRISKNPGYPREWVDGFRKAYDMWKHGIEAPLNGTPIRDWGSISPNQREHLLHLTIYTVEDLAAANESTLQRIGMGGRELKQKAQTYLDTANNVGKVAAQNSALAVQNAELVRQMAELRAFVHAQNGHPLTQAGHIHNLPPALTAGNLAPLAVMPVVPPAEIPEEDPF